MELPPFTPEMAHDPVLFIETQFLIKDERTGQPRLVELEPYQRDVLRDLYPPALEGEPRARNALYSTVKKAGKSTLLGALAFYHAVRKYNAEVYILATARDQAQAVLFDKVLYAVEHHPIWQKYSRQVGSKLEFPTLGGYIRVLPNNWRALEGFAPDATFIDEVHAFTQVGDRRSFDALVIPPHKTGIRMMTSYAGFEGESILLEQFWKLAEQGQPQHEQLPIRLNREASLWSFIDQGQEAWRMPWMQGEAWDAYLAGLRSDPSPTAYLRFAMNQWASSEQRFIAPEMWDALEVPEVKLAKVGEENRPIVLAADAATKRDCTALVGCTWNDEQDRVEVVYRRIWETRGSFDLRVLGDAILRLHRAYPGLIIEVHYDPYQMATVGQMLTEAGVNAQEFTQTTRRVQADTHLRDVIVGKRLAHGGWPDLRRHVLNAVSVENARGLRLAKEKTNLKIDGAVALSMAALAARERIGYSDDVVAVRNPFYS